MYKYKYETPKQFSNIIMNSDGEYLTGLWFENSRDTLKHNLDGKEKELSIFQETSKWLDLFFSGNIPDFIPKYKIDNLTPFRKEVIDINVITSSWWSCGLESNLYNYSLS